MKTINYLKFNEIKENDFLGLLNNNKIRKHLIGHEAFTTESLKKWIKTKTKISNEPGCKIRAIVCEKKLIGWCGIQLEVGGYEIAIIINDKYWGLGNQVFKDIMLWAKALGHREIFIHFLHTRPEYKFLKKIATKVYETNMLGDKFTTYQLAVK